MKFLLKYIPKELKNIIDIVLNYIYPQNITCILCDNPIKLKNTYSMCKNCFEEIYFIGDGCSKCGKPIINYNLERESLLDCSYCYNKNYYFDRAISCIEYNETSKKFILDYKYNNKTYLAKYIAKIMKEKLELEDLSVDYILFVPLHKKRKNKRGFNQSEKIARQLGELINTPIIDCIERVKNTKQLFSLTKIERQNELKNVFKINGKTEIIKNKSIILIDDIFTTGSTTNEISKLLKLNNVKHIYVFTLLTKSLDVYAKE